MSGNVMVYYKSVGDGGDMDHLSNHRHHSDEFDNETARKIMRDISNMSEVKQLILGIGTGISGGYLIPKFAKTFSIILGTSIIVLQLAKQNEYVRFNLVRVLGGGESEGSTPSNRRIRDNKWFRVIRKFLVEEASFTSGVIGGFLLGLGFS